MSASGNRWVCSKCCYVYDPKFGDERGIPAGVHFRDLPPDWCCPACSAPKDDFQRANEVDCFVY